MQVETAIVETEAWAAFVEALRDDAVWKKLYFWFFQMKESQLARFEAIEKENPIDNIERKLCSNRLQAACVGEAIRREILAQADRAEAEKKSGEFSAEHISCLVIVISLGGFNTPWHYHLPILEQACVALTSE